MSIVDLGNCSVNITGSTASRLTLDTSVLRLSGPGRFLSSTEKDAMLYLNRTMAVVGFCMWRGWTSLGP